MIQEYKTYMLAIRGMAINTVREYAKDISAFAIWAKENMEDARWSKIKRSDLDRYISEQAGQGISPATTNRQLAAISSIYNYMKREGYAVENPTRYESRRKIEKTQPNTITMSELKEAYRHTAGSERAMLGILMTTGIRIQELLDIRAEDINSDNSSIRIHGKGSKERTVYTTGAVIKEIQTIRTRQYGLIFSMTQRNARTVIYNALRRYCTAPQLTPHAIRHTYATHLATRGVNVTTIAKILGHESIRTTQKYIDMTQQDVIKTMREMNLFN